jgi:putative hydrolase of the HAD superfamily
MSRIDAVLFDLDNTLHGRDWAFRSWAAWFVRERLGLADGPAAEGAVGFITGLDAGGRSPKAAMFGRIKERYPALPDAADALALAFRTEMLAHLGGLEPATVRLLDGLDHQRIPWGIVTNGSAGQIERVRALGLAGRTRCVVVSEVVGVRKPATAIFLLAAARLGADPRRTDFVGDNPESDIVGAAAAGMRTAWLRHGRAWPEALLPVAPDFVVDALAEIVPLLGSAEPDKGRPSS